MKKTTLLIMAAGVGSRFGGGIKQLEPVGLSDEIIMDYSIHDAIVAGFNRLVFVIREDIEQDFRERIGNRVEKVCGKIGVEVTYVFQRLIDIPEGFILPDSRKKPWGTCHAVLVAKELLHGPFAVINADDYYGKDAYRKLHNWLIQDHPDNAIAMAGFILKNTLSENGGVTRGICTMNADGKHLSNVRETKNIVKTITGAQADDVELDPESYVSMNMWAFPANEDTRPPFLKVLEDGFCSFFETEVSANPENAEYLLPTQIGALLRQGTYTVEVLETRDCWFGVTYREDKETVMKSIRNLISDGLYGKELYADLSV